jgi:hypothetical protein
MQHIHAKEIKAWADGATIECKSVVAEGWVEIPDPSWSKDMLYRVKDTSNDDAYRELLRNYIDIKLKYETLRLAIKSLGDS